VPQWNRKIILGAVVEQGKNKYVIVGATVKQAKE